MTDKKVFLITKHHLLMCDAQNWISTSLSPMIFAAVDAPTIIDRFGAMNDILDSTYSYILCLDWFNSRAMSHASSSCFNSSSLSIDLNPWRETKINHHCWCNRQQNWKASQWSLSELKQRRCVCAPIYIYTHIKKYIYVYKLQMFSSLPLCGWGCDTDNHNSSIGKNLLQSFIILAFLQIIPQFLE